MTCDGDPQLLVDVQEAYLQVLCEIRLDICHDAVLGHHVEVVTIPAN
jgi:hypothetical protein